MNFLGLGGGCTVEIEMADAATRKCLSIRRGAAGSAGGEAAELCPLYAHRETVSGEVHVNVPPGKKVEHQGIKIELLGQIENLHERGSVYEFIQLKRELEPPGELLQKKTFTFEFSSVEMEDESYNGLNVRLRYFLRATVIRQYAMNVYKEKEFWVRNNSAEPEEENKSLKMEVGIEDCLHIEFEYSKRKYHLKDYVVGKIFFLLVRIRIKYMEIEIRRRESTGSGPTAVNESETLTKYEIMDGAPVRGESIPIRLFLSPYELTPTYQNVHNKFSVRYFLNLVLVDEEDRRYFKQTEIILYRKADS